MSVWDYWDETAAAKGNLRLLVPGKGWIAYDDREDSDGKVVERGSKEGIDSALINALSASNFSTLTGAGASLCARNAAGQPQAPSMRDLWNAVAAAVGAPAFTAVCGRFPNATIGENIEKLLSLCKVYLELNDAADENNQEVAAVKDFVSQAESCILAKVDFVSQSTTLAAHETYVRKIGRRGFRKTRGKLFTTNYDLTIEEAARRLRFTVIDGFSHSLDQVYDRQHFELDIVRRDATKDAPDYIPNVFQLYKLHGSTDWRRIGAEVLRSRDNTKGKPVLIYPRSSKYQEAFEPPYLDMMGAFQAALREPDTALVVAGFGFNDDHISRPILSALESNLSMRLIICDPGFILSEADLRGAPPEGPTHVIPTGDPHTNSFLSKIMSLAVSGDPRVHLINGRFEDLAVAMPDLIGETDRERHAERVKALRDPGL
ncbi:SIR2 family protein [uncultured Agrobacterium sp.]|uniref:SIR2 family protein n=1 Tax=uncultured Agrobacterium sp. TaxID=157277 RepID=UPI0025DF1499|nr:SIR2 family protein [uncultured Agrobacterium sp.]